MTTESNVLTPAGFAAKVGEFRRSARRTLAIGPDDAAPEPGKVVVAWKFLRQHGARDGAPRFITHTLDPNTPSAA